MRWFKFFFGVGTTLVCVWLLLKQSPPSQWVESLKQVDVLWICLASGAFCIDYACRTERWRIMMLNENAHLRWSECVGPLFISFAANNVLPLRGGDFIRILAFQQQMKVSRSFMMLILVIERLLDVIMVLGFLAFALIIFNLDAGMFMKGGCTVLFLSVGALLFFAIYPQKILNCIRWMGRHIHSGQRVWTGLERGVVLSVPLLHGKKILQLFFWSFLVWFSEGTMFWCLAKSLHAISNPSASWFAFPVGALATAIPSAPGYVGTFDYFTSWAMTSLGNEVGAAMAYTLLVHFMICIPSTIIGGLFWLGRSVKI